ncbi:MAG TPA: hypothetical protein DCE41_05255 [Cytophagales bacterium]|nr:hypothetical protein [Cytophagales bacterium]HAA17559.1 hypothetical protein [Cytophagales bacterium]HAP63453.1 hypothetical protein [Cytophagales bacterium]
MESVKYAEVDISRYPIIVVKLAEITPTVQHVDQLFEALEEALAKTDGYYVVISPFNGKFIPSDARVRLGQKARVMHEKYANRELGSVIVSESPIVRVMLQTINALFRPHSNHQRIVGSINKAIAYAEELLEKAPEFSAHS